MIRLTWIASWILKTPPGSRCAALLLLSRTHAILITIFPLHLGHSVAFLIFCLPFMSDLLEITGSGIAGQVYFLSPNPWCQSTPDNISVIAVPFTCCLSSLHIFWCFVSVVSLTVVEHKEGIQLVKMCYSAVLLKVFLESFHHYCHHHRFNFGDYHENLTYYF